MDWALAFTGAGIVVGLLGVYPLLSDRMRKDKNNREPARFNGGKSCAMSAACPARLHNTECQQCGLRDKHPEHTNAIKK